MHKGSRTIYVHNMYTFVHVVVINIVSRVELNQHYLSQQLIRINFRNRCLSHELIRLNFPKTSLSQELSRLNYLKDETWFESIKFWVGHKSGNMTHFGHHVTLAWLDLRSNFDLDLSKSFYIWIRRASTRQTRWYQNRCSTFKIKDFIVEKPVWKFLNFDPWRPQFWPETKNDRNDFEMIFRELSNAAFRFSLRRPGAEIMGRSNAPPPPAGGGKSRGPAGRGLKSLHTRMKMISYNGLYSFYET